jgi:hypothetical protein
VTKTEGSIAALNDADIRGRLSQWLVNQFAHDQSTVVCHEFSVPRPSARADVAVINGRLSGFEIKSDHDSLARLPQQIASYSAVFERVTLVTTAAHLNKATIYVPEWWGILVAHPTVPFRVIRSARMNRELEIEKAMYLLSCAELRDIAKRRNLLPFVKMRKTQLITSLCRVVSEAKLMGEIRTLLKRRLSQVSRQSHHSPADS